MENTNKKIKYLLKKYNRIAIEILSINDRSWDNMNFEIKGYYNKINKYGIDSIDIEALEKQVNDASFLLKTLKKLHYTQK